MAMFYKNVCQFNQCNLEFANVYDLIQHVEETHIPSEGEKKPDTQSQVACAPLSAICRYFQTLPDQPARPIIPKPTFQQPSPHIPSGVAMQAGVKKRLPSIIAQASSTSSHSPASGQTLPHIAPGQSSGLFHPPSNVIPPRSASSSRASEPDDESMSVDRESFSSESSMAVEEPGEPGTTYKIINPTGSEDRRYVCIVPGCKKSYKNLNGIRYHTKIAHMHAGIGSVPQPNAKKFKCQCGKAYKTSHGLHNHMLQTHHRQAQIPASTQIINTVVTGNAGGTGGTKFAGMSGVSASPSQGRPARGLALSMLGGGGPSSGQGPKQTGPLPSFGSSYFGQHTTVKTVGGGSSTTTLPSGVSVQVSNVGGGAPTTVQVGQQGALGVVASSSIGPSSSVSHGLHVSAGRRLSAMPHTQQLIGARPLKINSGPTGGSSGVNAFNTSVPVTTAGN